MGASMLIDLRQIKGAVDVVDEVITKYCSHKNVPGLLICPECLEMLNEICSQLAPLIAEYCKEAA